MIARVLRCDAAASAHHLVVAVVSAIVLGLGFTAGDARAHKASDSYLALTVDDDRIDGQWDIALRDLEMAVGLDTDADGEITWGELRARHDAIASYALARLVLKSGEAACPARVTEHLVDDHSDGTYAVLRFTASCPGHIRALTVAYRLLFDLDPQHRGLLRLTADGVTRTAILAPDRAEQVFQAGERSAFAEFVAYARDGVWHIWIGFDHILFLVSLLLPAVLVRRGRHRVAAPRFGDAFWEVLKIVTSFTVAHSITLSLATLGVVSLPSRVVESAIAASVVLAALNNVHPLVEGRRWTVAFLFGLVHGFGFATVLQDLGLPAGALATALVGFNLGVEAGQLAIVAVFLPVAFVLRYTKFYQRAVLIGGSFLIALLAAIWFVERAFDLRLLGL